MSESASRKSAVTAQRTAADAASVAGIEHASQSASTARPPVPVPVLRVAELCKTYRSKRSQHTSNVALENVEFTADRGTVTTIIGPSGCGKSTLLSCIAGLIPYESGRIEVNGSAVSGPGLDRAVVFQSASLLPWRTVRRNVEYGLVLRKEGTPAERKERAMEAVGRVGLTGSENAYPHELSGGMQQRVNLARALVTSASLILMDEPFGSLDAFTKEALQDDLLHLVDTRNSTILFVTHDLEEAVLLGDSVIVMSASPGRIVKIVPIALQRPRSRQLTETAAFTGTVTMLRRILAGADTDSKPEAWP
jgi:NitT/TauT family transport system ATP-binding protein